jgi:phospholipase D1/2
VHTPPPQGLCVKGVCWTTVHTPVRGSVTVWCLRAAPRCTQVVVILPLLPAFDGHVESTGQAGSLLNVLHFQQRTILKAEGMFPRLKRAGIKPEDYIRFYGLRTYAHLSNQWVTEQIYVHSKCLLVDDKLAIIGSANINDRSMVGSRDSEVGAVIVDADSVPGGVGFAKSLRLALMKEYLGLSDEVGPCLPSPSSSRRLCLVPLSL